MASLNSFLLGALAGGALLYVATTQDGRKDAQRLWKVVYEDIAKAKQSEEIPADDAGGKEETHATSS